MKRLIAAGILLVIVLASYLTSYWYIKETCSEVKTLVEQCEDEYKNNNNNAYNTAKNLEKLWGDKEKILSFFVNHDRIDEIELSLSSLTVYSNKAENTIFYEYSGKILMLLHQLKEESEINTHSIF